MSFFFLWHTFFSKDTHTHTHIRTFPHGIKAVATAGIEFEQPFDKLHQNVHHHAVSLALQCPCHALHAFVAHASKLSPLLFSPRVLLLSREVLWRKKNYQMILVCLFVCLFIVSYFIYLCAQQRLADDGIEEQDTQTVQVNFVGIHNISCCRCGGK